MESFRPLPTGAQTAAIHIPPRPAAPASARAPVAVAHGVRVRRRGRDVLHDVELSVDAGCVTLVVGERDAGVSVLLGVLAGQVRPDRGTVHVCDVDVHAEPRRAAAVIGYVPRHARSFDLLEVGALLRHVAMLRAVPRAQAHGRIADVVELLGLEGDVRRRMGDCSTGCRTRVLLASALLHAPRVLVLDEPFAVLDPAADARVVRVIVDFAHRGGAVVLSTPRVDDLDGLGDDAIALQDGRVVASGPADAVAGVLRDRRADAARAGEELPSWLLDFSG